MNTHTPLNAIRYSAPGYINLPGRHISIRRDTSAPGKSFNDIPPRSELFDVGGSQAHRNSRHVFYNNIAGVILVHDLSNRKSQRNLDK